MADNKKFEIDVVTKADTTGIRQTEAGLDRIAQRQAAAEAKWRVSPLNPANRPVVPAAAPAAPATGGGIAGLGGLGTLTGAAIGVGIAQAFSAAIAGAKELNDEMDKYAETVARAAERSRELALGIIESGEEAAKFARIRTLPLTEQIKALDYQLKVVKTEFQLATQAMDVKAMQRYQQQINSLTGALEQAKNKERELREEQAKKREIQLEKETAAEAKFLTGAYKGISPQAKAILDQEAAARKAEAVGDQRSADLYRKTEEAFKRAATPEQLEEARQLGPYLTDILNELKKQTSQWQ